MTQAVHHDDAPVHPLLTPHDRAPLVDTRVSKVIAAPMQQVFQHFFGSEPALRLELHRDHVKQYHIHRETADTLEYEFVFEAYGTRNWGRAAEVATRHLPDGGMRIDVEVKEGPLAGQTIVTLFREVPGATEVTQVNRVWPGANDLMVKLLGNRLPARLAALAGVHLEQHRHELEGLGRFQDKFSREHQAELQRKRANPVTDLLKTGRAITLPIVVFPVLAAAALASGQGRLDPLILALSLVGASLSLLAANLLNDLWDFRGGADQSARGLPGAIETGSGAFVEGRWSLRKGWTVTALLYAAALACGIAIAVLGDARSLLFAAAGALIAYVYVGPPFPLAYKGRGLGELAIFAAFGLAPVLGGLVAYGGTLDARAWQVAGLFGATSVLVLYHHHFLHWHADKAAGKLSPVALLGPRDGAAVGLALAALVAASVVALVALGTLPAWGLVAALPALLLVAPHAKLLRGSDAVTDRVRVAGAAFGVMALTDLLAVLALWSG